MYGVNLDRAGEAGKMLTDAVACLENCTSNRGPSWKAWVYRWRP
ncbi:MAG: hypothetical protein AB9891_10050 [Anaerolineaceae bacterium]